MVQSRRTGAIVAAAIALLGAGGIVVASQGSSSSEPLRTSSPTADATRAATTPPAPTPTPTLTGPLPLPPNMQALPGSDLSLTSDAGVRLLRFATTLINVGAGPLELRPDAGASCPPDQRGTLQWTYVDDNGDGRFDPTIDTSGEPSATGCMLFHPTHDHWHFDASARYVLSQPGTTDPIVMSDKVSFCMRDSDPTPQAATAQETYGKCTRDSIQGVSAGWLDVYEARLAGQALPLPRDLPDGSYCLQITVDPHSLLRESNEDDNVSWTGVSIQGGQALAAPPTGCV